MGFDGTINDEIKGNIIKQFKSVTPFEYDEEYLILQLEKETTNESDFIQFEIQDIVAIYPLSQQAKTSIESKIDQRIRLEKPIFETILPTIVTEIKNKEVEKAISALWKICKIEDSLEKYSANIGLENIFNGFEYRKHGTKSYKIQNGNYWEYLIAYDYYQYFPEGTIRYFYQLGEVFSYFKGKVDGIEGTKIEETLKQIGSGNFEQILQKFNKETLPASFIEAMNTIGKSEFNPIIVSVLFLKWKADFSKQDIDILDSSLFYKGKIAFIEQFPTEVKLALILFGAFFGFRKFYDNYYDVLNLRIYKNYKPQQIEVDTAVEQFQEQITTDLNDKIQEPVYTIDESVLLVNLKRSEKVLIEKDSQDSIIKEHLTPEQTSTTRTTQDNSEAAFVEIMSPYLHIIEDLLSKQTEVKLKEIKNSIKKECNETKSVDEIKDLIIKLKIEVESVQGKTNTIKKLNFKS
jgi:hypothetical protein